MSALQIAIAGTAAVVAQTALAWFVSGAAANLDVPLVVVVLAALSRGPLAGLWTGTAVGFFQDVLSGGIVGVSGLCKSVVGVAVGLAGARLLATAAWQRGFLVCAATFVHAGCFFGTYALVPTTPIGNWSNVAVQGVANGLVGSVAVGVAGSVSGRRRQVRHARGGREAGRWRPKPVRG